MLTEAPISFPIALKLVVFVNVELHMCAGRFVSGLQTDICLVMADESLAELTDEPTL
jgi:hypothetical protein